MDFPPITTKHPQKMRRRKNRSLLLIALLVFGQKAYAADSLRVLTRDAFMSIVLQYHPVVKQAGIRVERAQAGVLEARGGFDPSFKTELDQKTFDGTRYYSYVRPAIAIPTWYGVEIKAGLEDNTGERISTEYTPGRTTYAGISLPAHNLLFDQRRAALRQARTFHELSKTEQQLVANDLLYEALAAYWNWTLEYRIYRILTEAVRVNETRIRFVRTEYEQGARPAIDTIEALAQLQNIQLQREVSSLALQNAGIAISGYLWLDKGMPVEWNGNLIPDTSDYKTTLPDALADLDKLLSFALSRHPKLSAINYKIDILQIDNRLKAQYLLPKLTLNANFLNKGYALPEKLSAGFLENNYKLGMDISIPLFMRQARGAYRASKLKLEEGKWERNQELLNVENKIKTYYNEVRNIQQQIMLYNQMYLNAEKLFLGEKFRFEAGESTLFLLNTRENKLLETAQKLQEVTVKWHKSYTGLLWASALFTVSQ